MKKIIIYISILLAFVLVSCSNKTISVKLESIQELTEFISYNTEYELNKKDTFTFPTISSSTFVDDEYINNGEYVSYEKTTYTFVFYGWKSNKDKDLITSSTIKVSSNETFTPSYDLTEKKFNVNLYTYGGNITDESNTGNSYILPTPKKENYNFEGWYYNTSLMGNKVTEISFNDNNETLYAKYIPTIEYINQLINNIPSELTVLDISSIKEIKDLYNLLPYSEKVKVENYNKVLEADKQLPDLEKAYRIYSLIEEIIKEEITLELKYELESIISEYNALTETQKTYVTNIELLNPIQEEIDRLFELYGQEALDFDLKIASIPINNEIIYENEILELYNEYFKLDSNVESLLNTKTKLFRMYENLNNIKQDTDTITYILSTPNNKNIYTSKQDLFKCYFTDFYYYILAYHGPQHLEKNGIKNVEDFVKLAGDFNGGGTSNLYGIGNLTSAYMIKKDINGILENQKIDSFFGFCYKNNIYTDLLPFFINFFAYWRIDERYANTSNYGADIFAEGWAPVVDIAKFFYYDEETSYVKTERMIDCLTNTATVAYGMEGTLPTNLKLRGYIFEGWYNNPNFEGNKVTNVSLNGNKVYLYAKWSVDINQQEEDFKNLVDIYIYNLTTKKAVVNSITVGYVKDMYNKLTKQSQNSLKYLEDYKKLVEKYS